MRRILNQAANAAAKLKGSTLEILYCRYVPRLKTQANHWNNCSQTLPPGLEDIAPRNPVRRARPRGQESVQAKAHPKNDPSTPQAWLPNRTEPFSISHPSMTAIPAWARFSTLRREIGKVRPSTNGFVVNQLSFTTKVVL